MMRVLLLAAVMAVALAAVPTAMADPAYSYDSDLRWWVHNSLEVASYSQGSQIKHVPKEVYVRCYTSPQAFEQGFYNRGGYTDARYTIAYYAGGSAINMRDATCALAREFTTGWVTQQTAGAFKTLLHEAIHRQGVHGDERMTEALAIASMEAAGQLVEYNQRPGDDNATWEASAPAGARAMRLAWQQSRRYLATKYLTSWPRIGWYQRNMNWADV